MRILKNSNKSSFLSYNESLGINALLAALLAILCTQFIKLRGTGDVTNAFVPWIRSALKLGFLESYRDRVTAYPPGYIAIPYALSKYCGISAFWSYKIFLLLSLLLAVFCCIKYLNLRSGLLLGLFLVYPALVLGYGDVPLIAILLLILICVDSHKFFISGLIFGILISVKFTPLLLIPMIVIYSIRKRNEFNTELFCRSTIGNLIRILLGGMFWLIPFIHFTGTRMFVNNLKLALLNGYLSGNAPNLGWIITKFEMGKNSIPQYSEKEQLIRFVYVDVHSTLYTSMKFLAMTIITLLILKFFRRTNDLENLALVICLVIFVYYEFAPGVHENHLTLAIPFAIILINSSRKQEKLLGGYIIFISLFNLFSFYTLKGTYNESRILFGTDFTFLLAAIEVSSAVFLATKYLLGKP